MLERPGSNSVPSLVSLPPWRPSTSGAVLPP